MPLSLSINGKLVHTKYDTSNTIEMQSQIGTCSFRVAKEREHFPPFIFAQFQQICTESFN